LLIFSHSYGAAPATVDVSMNPPASASVGDLKGRVRGYFAKVQDKDALQQTRDAGIVAEYGDVYWQLRELIDNKQSLHGLEEFGVTQRSDGSVEVDVKNFPQWTPVSDQLKIIETEQDVDAFARALRDRGFEDLDFDALKTYVRTHNRERVMFTASKPLIQYYASLVRSKRGATIAQAKAHSYRLFRSSNEVNRVWAEGLMSRLRPQAQRILKSTLEETHRGFVIAPSENIEEGLRQEMALIRSDVFDRAMLEKEKELAR